MKLVTALVVACMFFTASAYAVDPVRSETTCEQLAETYAPTAAAKERFSELEGSCEGVYEVDGHLYVRSQAVIRARTGNRVKLYLPATDHTFEVNAEADGRVWVGSRKMRVRDMNRGDEIGIYLSVEQFAEERVEEIAFVTEDDHVEDIVLAPVEEVVALPTTG